MTELDETIPGGLQLAEDVTSRYRDVIDFTKEVFGQNGGTRQKDELLIDEVLDNDVELILAVKTIAVEELAVEAGHPLPPVKSTTAPTRRKNKLELGSIKPRAMARALGAAGMEMLGITDNSHLTFRNPTNGKITHVVLHKNELGPRTVNSMLSQLDLRREQFLHPS